MVHTVYCSVHSKVQARWHFWMLQYWLIVRLLRGQNFETKTKINVKQRKHKTVHNLNTLLFCCKHILLNKHKSNLFYLHNPSLIANRQNRLFGFLSLWEIRLECEGCNSLMEVLIHDICIVRTVVLFQSSVAVHCQIVIPSLVITCILTATSNQHFNNSRRQSVSATHSAAISVRSNVCVRPEDGYSVSRNMSPM
jgi:hypothetical protein